MEKIQVKICCGTTCYMLGASKLMKMEMLMPPEWQELVDVSAIPCMEECYSDNLCGAPYVRVNHVLLRHATVESVFEAIQDILKEASHEQ